jgi:hypothetical protein
MFGSVLEAPGLAGRAFSYEYILSPVGRSAQMPAAFLIPSSSALLQHEKSNDVALNCATAKRHTMVISSTAIKTHKLGISLRETEEGKRAENADPSPAGMDVAG